MENQVTSIGNKFLSWFLFFITYTFGYLGFLAYTETQQGITFKISNFFIYFLTSGLLFSTAIIIIASIISSLALYKSLSKILLFIVVGTVLITVYRSFSYFAFFLRFEQILIIYFIFLIAAIIGLLFKKISEKSPIGVKITSFLLTILVILGGSFLGISAPNTVSTTKCSSFTERGQRLGCFYNLGIKNSDLDSCLEVPSALQYPAGPECVQKALQQLESENKLDTTLCSALKNPEAKSICYYKISVNTKNKTLCDNVIDSYSDENMSVTTKKSGVISGPVEIPNKQNCLAKTN